MDTSSPLKLAEALREQVGVKKSYASQLANGSKMPSLTLAVEIERKLGIPPSHWVGAVPDGVMPPASQIEATEATDKKSAEFGPATGEIAQVSQ
jgi:transcriptional regulator with XRE-family HTH domain